MAMVRSKLQHADNLRIIHAASLCASCVLHYYFDLIKAQASHVVRLSAQSARATITDKRGLVTHAFLVALGLPVRVAGVSSSFAAGVNAWTA